MQPVSPLSRRPNPAAPFSAINFGFCALRNYFRPAPKNLQPIDSKNPLISVPNLAHTGKYAELHPLKSHCDFRFHPHPPISLFVSQVAVRRVHSGFPDCARFLKCLRSFKPSRPAQFESWSPRDPRSCPPKKRMSAPAAPPRPKCP
jgi:hypothetical protein